MDLSTCFLHTLGEAEAKLLAELRSKVPSIVAKAKEGSQEAAARPVQSIWGVNVEVQSEASDIVLLKYLRAEEKNVDIAADRIAQTLIFRADCQMEELIKAELPDYFQGHDEITGWDTEGRPVMISHFGNMDIDKVFGDAEAFVRYRVQLMEKSIAMLPFKKGAAEDLCQVHNYAGVLSSMYKSHVKDGVSAVSKVFERHYPEFKGVTVFVNFPAFFSKFWKAFSTFLPERTLKKFVILGSNDHEALFEKLAPGLVPDSLGGLYTKPPSKLKSGGRGVVCKARVTEEVQLLQVEVASKVAFELRVCVSDIAYQVVFVPSGGAEESVVKESEQGTLLKAEDGIVAGEYDCSSAGTLLCRFRNEGAWFKQRVCACRAELA
mmetsp:Transcript_11072/g.25344  ORF Transcript_11072/g.25344 Transcript_11072/m.25344 type:complete len:378 (+) Transcript_11072:112-1245(+)